MINLKREKRTDLKRSERLLGWRRLTACMTVVALQPQTTLHFGTVWVMRARHVILNPLLPRADQSNHSTSRRQRQNGTPPSPQTRAQVKRWAPRPSRS